MLGRYRRRYNDFDRPKPARAKVTTIDETTPLSDLATATFGSARVSCWTTARDRLWGRDNHKHAGILKFKFQASGPQGCHISDFEVDLHFTSSEPETDSGNNPLIDDGGEICFLDLPAPTYVQSDDHDRKSIGWKFRSKPISDDANGQANIARWTWETKGDCRELEGRTLHSGISIRHPGRTFVMTCQVRGKVWKPGSRNLRLKFSNNHHRPRRWKVVPQLCMDDLRDHIERLESEIVRLNGYSTSDSIAPQTSSMPPSRNYGSTEISGSSTVHMGDTIHNYWTNSATRLV